MSSIPQKSGTGTASAPGTGTAEGFIGSVFKYSISTFVNMGIMGLTIILTGLFVPTGVNGQIGIFTSWTGTIMTIAILGLDQALIRFFNEPPAGLKRSGLFRLCFYFSSAAVLVAGALCSTLLLRPIYRALGFTMVGSWAVPLLFLNAFFYMIARYFNVLYRMEGNIRVYTAESILMQFFYKLFVLLGVFFGGDNPVPAMVLCSVCGLGAFALVFSFLRRDALRPRPAEFKSGGYKTILPYGLAIAPTAVLLTFNYSYTNTFLNTHLGEDPAGIYGFAYQLSNIVSMVQGGFAAFWGPYMFEHYKTEQERIKRVHNYLNFVILVFFAALVAFEDVAFIIFSKYAAALPVFPLMMLSAVFTILCETTVYGNAIARKPIYDTLGYALSFAVNVAGLWLLATGRLGLYGAAIAIAAANFAMFLLRTITAQRLYRSIESPAQTAVAILIAVALAVAGTVWAHQFLLKLAASAIAAGLYCLLYRKQLGRLWQLGLGILRGLLKKP
ncbi:lipopolysaccharide biosynthesis protein [Ruminococcaceae bacterium OttesenSCG-928-D13]|nr:lipopolysaccharide biosynthesis protein [Ruminococcaceae bacterium OttesenSCG-928-D13]